MTTTPELAMPNFSQPFTLETGAYKSGVGTVLMQQVSLFSVKPWALST